MIHTDIFEISLLYGSFSLHQLRTPDADSPGKLTSISIQGASYPAAQELETVGSALINSLADPEVIVRSDAVNENTQLERYLFRGDAFYKQGEPLVLTLDSPEADAAESLLQLNRARLREVWKKALKDPSDDVRGIAIKALTDLGYAEEAVDELVRLLQDDDYFVRVYIAESLLQLNHHRLLEIWKKALKDPSDDVRDIATKALTDLGEESQLIEI